MIIKFEINNQIMKRLDDKVIVNKCKDYVSCNFLFKTPEWQNVEKFAIFKNSANEAYLVQLGTESDCTCTPPSDVLKGNYFKVSVYGGDRITTDEKTIALVPSGYTTQIKIPENEDIDIFTRLFDALNSKVSQITYENGVMRVYSEEGEIAVFDLVTTNNLSNIAFTGSFEDLNNVPSQFPPSQHEHNVSDIVDYEQNIDNSLDNLIDNLTEKVRKI